MIPAIVEQYITKLLDPSVPKNERENTRYVLTQIRDLSDKAIRKYDGKRA
jgi:hypothetical protein